MIIIKYCVVFIVYTNFIWFESICLTLRNSRNKIPYTGKTIKPDVIVKSGTRRIKSIYYNCYYSGLGKKVGKYTITVKGVSPYIGEESVEYEIIPQDLSKKTARLSKTVYQYDGRACKPTVYISGLYSGIDYTLSYRNNIRPGIAEVMIRGRGNYTGSITKNFTIKKPVERRIGKLLQPMKVKAKKKVFPVKRSKVKKKSSPYPAGKSLKSQMRREISAIIRWEAPRSYQSTELQEQSPLKKERRKAPTVLRFVFLPTGMSAIKPGPDPEG